MRRLTCRSTEIAQNFKEQGNDYFKGRRYREALGFYTQGIDAQPADILLTEALLCNRAACNLELSEDFVRLNRYLPLNNVPATRKSRIGPQRLLQGIDIESEIF